VAAGRTHPAATPLFGVQHGREAVGHTVAAVFAARTAPAPGLPRGMTVSGSTNARIAASVAGTGMPTRSNAVQPEQRLDNDLR